MGQVHEMCRCYRSATFVHGLASFVLREVFLQFVMKQPQKLDILTFNDAGEAERLSKGLRVAVESLRNSNTAAIALAAV